MSCVSPFTPNRNIWFYDQLLRDAQIDHRQIPANDVLAMINNGQP
jgi:hypothetical protein